MTRGTDPGDIGYEGSVWEYIDAVIELREEKKKEVSVFDKFTSAKVSITIKQIRKSYRVQVNGVSVGTRATSFVAAQEISRKIFGVSPAAPENVVIDLRRSRPRNLPYIQVNP